MESLIDPVRIEALLRGAWSWIDLHVLTWHAVVQAFIIIGAYGFARWLAPTAQARLAWLVAHPRFPKYFTPVVRAVEPLVLPVIWLALQWFTVFAAEGSGWPNRLIESAVSLLTAWVVIRLASVFVRDPGWSRTLAVVAWSIAALNLVGLLTPVMHTLDSMAIRLGDVRLSILGVIKAGIVFAVMLWLAGIAMRLIENRLDAANGLSPSARVLFGKVIRVLLIGLACVASLQSVGIDLTALAVFGGAIGLGLGFGLQKVVSNLISGVILLMDKSVKPGDVISIGDTFGWINRLGARYVSVITRDGIEHLIPNEELISQRVENWSYSDTLIRQKLPVGVSYTSDVKLAMQLAVEATSNVERVLKEPAPVCRLMKFGADAVELELRIWINDPQQGIANVRSDVLLRIWELYHQNGIEFPFSQRDLHLKSSVPLDVRILPPAGATGEG